LYVSPQNLLPAQFCVADFFLPIIPRFQLQNKFAAKVKNKQDQHFFFRSGGHDRVAGVMGWWV
jgi:hypothetical protein